MPLIVILLCLALQRYWQPKLHFSHTAPLPAYFSLWRPLGEKHPFWWSSGGIILLLLPVLIVVGLIDLLLTGWLFNILDLLFELVILWFCLPADDYSRQLTGYLHATEQNDWQAAQQQAASLFKIETADLIPDDWSALHQQVTRGLLLRATEQLFGVLFWYLLLGVVGAVGYYAVLVLAQRQTRTTEMLERFHAGAQPLLDVLAWLPVRAVAIIYALAGNFSTGWNYCREHMLTNPQQNAAFITETGFAALENNSNPRSVLQLINRTLFIVLVLLAVFTLGGLVQ